MKHIILFISLLVGFFSFAQNKKRMGPAYKNAHPSFKYDSNNTLVIAEKPNSLKGPSYKNQKPWNKKNVANKKIFFKMRKPLRGAKAKNHKPWDTCD